MIGLEIYGNIQIHHMNKQNIIFLMVDIITEHLEIFHQHHSLMHSQEMHQVKLDLEFV